MSLLKRLSITCISYLLVLVLIKLAIAPLYRFFPEKPSNDHLKVIVSKLSLCESGNNQNAIHYNDGRVGLHSYGVLQFQRPTFQYYWVRLVDSDADSSDIDNLFRDPASQRMLAEKMLESNWETRKSWWNCSKKIGIL